jgi:hypothetical protein
MRLRYFLAGSLVAIGILIGLICLLGFFWPGAMTDPRAQVDQQTMAIGSFVILGVPPIILGTALWWKTQQRKRVRTSQRLKKCIFQPLQQTQGQISVLEFAMAAKLDGDAAKRYLDNRAREFNADFDVDAQGSWLYCFTLPANATLQSAEPDEQSAEPGDNVILPDYPAHCRSSVAEGVQHQSNLSDFQVQEVMQNAKKRPVKISQGITIEQGYFILGI